ncbi:flagellar basal body P-ring formation chaperone FlgA [Helicobacter mustelae]|uniref:Flagella basal body P-ring formation protein FlgA n=1 Tax=Helicobacter mustelae (strain ATCC 43772 / CCUG 25715 / CIP 103759 / LMG 18044 / NCTC 12198 / R85-136P) TaxID=679897 RepID=D3UGB6_HELM1|nr:flagellar basal body P-ring formation chaperone FlgA [Helicobacter mustelae]CBG39537.1 Putative flagellum ring component [Helicobacter mustelae 12198]SQH71049.1 flagellum ring component [Helicobacter mustelae]STP12178.1 flagellum ring component [Helicobacter mustelae]
MKKWFFFLAFLHVLWSDNITSIEKKIKQDYEAYYKNNALVIKGIKLLLDASSQINEVRLEHIALEDEKFGGDGRVRIIFVFENKKYTHSIAYKIHGDLKVVFAKIGIKKSQDITKENTLIKTIPLGALQNSPIGLSDIDNISAKIFIPSGGMIVNSLVANKILIRKNDSFLAIYKEGNMQIQLTLIAKQDGAKDAIIEAYNPESKKTLRVRVLSNAMGEIL